MDIVTAFTIWLQSQNIPVAGCESKDGVRITRIDYAPSATPEQKASAEAAKANFAIPQKSDLQGFKNAILLDSTIPATAKAQLATSAQAVNELVDKPVLLQELWTGLKQLSVGSPLGGNCTDSVSVISKIEGYALQFHIPLTSP